MATIEVGTKAVWFGKHSQTEWSIVAKAHDEGFGPHIELHGDGVVLYLSFTLDELLEVHRLCGVAMGEEDGTI